MAGIDPDLPFFYPQTLEERVAESLASRRTPMLLLMIFAGVALFLGGGAPKLERRHLMSPSYAALRTRHSPAKLGSSFGIRSEM